jgi:hypothetical protein
MDVRVLEAREEHLAGEVDDLRARAGELADVVVRADGRDAPVADRHRVRPPSRRVDRVDGAVHEDQVGLLIGHVSPFSPPRLSPLGRERAGA